MSLVCLASVVLSACTGGSGSAVTSSTSPSDRSGGAAVGTAGSVLSAYRAMWADLVVAARTSDFQSPLLSQHASGSALTLFVRGLARDQLHDIVTRGAPTLHPSVTSLVPPADPTRATVRDCFDDTRWVEYTTSGAKAKNPPGGPRDTTATLVRSGGVWKVTDITVGAVGTC